MKSYLGECMAEKKVILIVEDNPDDELLIIRALKKNSISNEIVVNHDGAEALNYLFGEGPYKDRDMRIMPHVTLLDLKLPKLSGLDVLQKVRANEKTRGLPIVILTSSDEHKDLLECYKYGANSYIRKPVDFNKFFDVIKQIGSYWLLLNESPPINNV